MLLQSGLDTVVLLGVGAVALGLVALLFALLYTEHRKEIALIESGEYGDVTARPAPWLLGAGLVLFAVGMADVFRAVWLGSVPDEGLTLTALGLAALAYYWFRRREVRAADGERGDA